jgi:hypothetical protein
MNERDIRITAGSVEISATLNDTNTATRIWEVLSIEATVSTWGDEIYFGIPVETEEYDSQEVVELGDLGYWPPGNAFCMFFGRTPASRGDEIRPASAVNVVGFMHGDPTVLKQVAYGEPVVIERVSKS